MSDFVWASTKNSKKNDDYENSEPNDNDIVREVANHIYFYSEVKRARILDLNKSLRKIREAIRQSLKHIRYDVSRHPPSHSKFRWKCLRWVLHDWIYQKLTDSSTYHY